MYRPSWDNLDLDARLSQYYDYDRYRDKVWPRSKSPFSDRYLDRLREFEGYQRSRRRSRSPYRRSKSRSPRRKRPMDKPAKSLVPYEDDKSPSPARIESYGKYSLSRKHDDRAPLTRDMCSDVPGGRKRAPIKEFRRPLLPSPLPPPPLPPLSVSELLSYRRHRVSDILGEELLSLPPPPPRGYDDPYGDMPMSLRPPPRDRPLDDYLPSLRDPISDMPPFRDRPYEDRPLGIRIPSLAEKHKEDVARDGAFHEEGYSSLGGSQPSRLPFADTYDYSSRDESQLEMVGEEEEEEEEMEADAKAIEISKSRGLYCLICEAAATSIEQYQKHLQGVRHKKMLKKLGLKDELGTCSEAAAEVSESSSAILETKFQDSTNEIINVLQCIVCKMKCPADALGPHITNRVHIAAEKEWLDVGRKVPKFKDMFEETGEKLECLDTVRVPETTNKILTSDVHVCKVCNIAATCYETLQQHLQGKKHAKMLRQLGGTHGTASFYCEVCNVYTNCEDSLKQHKQGKRHAMNSQPYQLSYSNASGNHSMAKK